MPPFKNKGKKKPKKKGKRGKKDDWTLEDGTVFAEKKKTHDEDGKPLWRKTQEKDEQFRRGRLKQVYQKQKDDFVKKMSSKVKFYDAVHDYERGDDGEEENEHEESEMEDEEEEEIQVHKKERHRSSKSVLNRLQEFTRSGDGNRRHYGKHDNNIISKFLDEDMDSPDNDMNEEDKKDDGEEEESDHESEENALNSDGDEDLDIDEDEDGALEGSMLTKTAAHWLYNVADESSVSFKDNKSTLLRELNDKFALYGNIKLPEEYQSQLQKFLKSSEKSKGSSWSSLASIFGQSLPKLWHSRAEMLHENESTGNITPNLLSYLSLYPDALIEGCDYKSDESMLHTLLVHTCIHVLRSRMTVMKHNSRLKKKMAEKRIDRVTMNYDNVDASDTMKDDEEEDDDDVLIQKEKDRRRQEKKDKKEHRKKTKADHTMDTAAPSKTGSGEELAPISTNPLAEENEYHMKDQGFVRPRVLILCPFRSTALRIFHQIRDIYGDNTSVASMDKIMEEFSPDSDVESDEGDSSGSESSEEEEEEGEEKGEEGKEVDEATRKRRLEKAALKKKKKKMREARRKKASKAPKPEDWQYYFKRSNTDDDFKVGIQVNPGRGKGNGKDKGVYMRMFSDFFISDIIVASPLGLRLIIEKHEEDDEESDNLNALRNADFLSSVEMVVLHEADVMYMQNWDHVEFVLKHCNNLPQANHDTDFERVRSYFLDGKSASRRQCIITSSITDPSIQSTFRRFAQSLSGQIRLKASNKEGVIGHVQYGSRQIFQKVSVKSFDAVEEKKFEYFKEYVLGPLLRTKQNRTLIVAPSYLHYVRLRNEMIRMEANACYVCEYSRNSEVTRGRSRFFHGYHDILLYSGRCHFFKRYPIRGAQHIIFYSIPEIPHFYCELSNLLSNDYDAVPKQSIYGDQEADVDASSSTANGVITTLVLFSKYEAMALERVVGKKKAAHMIKAEKETFLFQS